MTDDNVTPIRKSHLRSLIEGEVKETRQLGFTDDEAKKLDEMNRKHALVHDYHGRPMVLSYIPCPLTGKPRMQFIAPESIFTIYCNQSVPVTSATGREGYIDLGKWWLKHAERREYRSVLFDPTYLNKDQWGVNVQYGALNMWNGFGIEAKMGKWYHTKEHIYRILCNGDREKFLYLMRWMAWTLQNPGLPAEVAVVFKGKKGAGKGVIANALRDIFGDHGTAISNRKHLTGQFNNHLEHICFLLADEAYYPGDKEVEGVLKSVITEPTIQIEGKFQLARSVRNCLKIVMCTNNEWVIPASEDERRFFINEVNDDYTINGSKSKKRVKYFNDLFYELQHGGKAAMMYDLLKLKLDGWHPRHDIPRTSEMNRQVFHSLNYAQKGLYEFLQEGLFPGNATLLVSGNDLTVQLKLVYPEYDKSNTTSRAQAFLDIGATKRRTSKGMVWQFPPLDVARASFIRAFGTPPEPFTFDEKGEATWKYKNVGADY